VHRQSSSTSITSTSSPIPIPSSKPTNTIRRSLTLKEAETLTLRTLKQVMEEKLDAKNVQLSSITKDKGFRIYTDEEMKECVGKLEGN
jgi:20S proteasome subunit alpha 5